MRIGRGFAMSRLISFDDCIARPDENGHRYYLKTHLEGVREWTRSFFQIVKLDNVEKALIEIAAISHDIGKANVDWQAYINGRKKRGPNHSWCGAMFFSYVAYHYLKILGKWKDYKILWLQLTRDIADHHGELKDLVENQNVDSIDFSKMDVDGIQKWIYTLFPIIKEHKQKISSAALNDWADDFDEFVENLLFDIHLEKRNENQTIIEKIDMLQKWRMMTSILISSDRFEIKSVQDKRIKKHDWNAIKQQIENFCKSNRKGSLAIIRSKAQEDILQQWKTAKDCSYYVLEMPTGYGKTVTALKLAAEIGKEKGHSKIVYVAPYLSILEQNAEEIEKITKKMSLQHHSMAILNDKTLEENKETDSHSTLHMQAWANEIVCTSFVQWMRAIFPRRAQETIRRSYLNDAIVIIDEPQIIDASVWNLFLVGLESLTKLYNLTIIFCSATMPPFYKELNEQSKRLSIASKKEDDRYYIQRIEELTKQSCAQKLAMAKDPTAIAILNTIRDAMDVYDELSNINNNDTFETYLLHGLMIPIHKAIQINRVRNSLRSKKTVRVVSTQIIEAGVNVSFHYMYRALPIIPSLVQAAGRVNRHRELPIGRIETSQFLRNEKDTRFIYSTSLKRISDELLFQKEIWYEHEMEGLVRLFYEKMFTENSYEAVLQDIHAAYLGNWKHVSRHDVFRSDDYYRLPIFIPFEWNEERVKLFPKGIQLLLNEFEIENPTHIYEIFLNTTMRNSWSYEKNKRFMILFNQFVVNVPVELALKIVPKDDFLQYRVPMLEDSSRYQFDKGLIANNDVLDSII